MSYYLLATLKVKYGQQRKFYEVMSHLKPVLEKAGWKLVGAYENSIGRLNTVIDLVGDQRSECRTFYTRGGQ